MTSQVLCAHLCALGTTLVWGMTFISSKILMNHGSTPLEVLFFRFVLALLVMFCMKPKIFRHGRGWKEELLFLGAGASGITLYFCFENTAISITYASNVSLIICTAPFLTGLAAHYLLKEDLHGNFFVGFVVAIAGIACISFNGATYLNLNPAGDLLAVGAAASWALYSIFTRRIFSRRYPLLEATRRILFWGLVTSGLVLLFQDEVHLPDLGSTAVWANFLFLGVLASAICFVTWNYGLRVLGAVRATAYVYLTPVVTVVGAFFLLDEHITLLSATGMALTLAGLVLSEMRGNVFGRLRRQFGGDVL